MFDLEKAITDWRQQMLAAGIKTPVPLEELEVHLRDEIERQTKSGLNKTEAFKSAVQKIGPAHSVQNEFEKVGDGNDVRKWKVVQILYMAFSSLFPLAVGSQVFYFKTGNISGMTSGEKISCLAAVTTFSLLAWGGRLSCGILPVIRARQIRDAIGVSVSVLVALWWIIFLCIIVPRYDFTICQFVVTFLWAFIVPGGILIGLTWGIETAARRRMATASL